MRKLFSTFLVSMLVMFSVPIAVFAQTPPVSEVKKQEADTVQATDGGRQERINKYKETLRDKLSEEKSKRIVKVCKAAQKVTARLINNLEKVSEKRKTKYGEVSDKLSKLVSRLKEASVDTTKLEVAIAELKAKSDAIVADIGEYKVALDDLSNMDCESDPEGFKAALDSARRQRSSLVSKSKAVKSYVTETIRPILKEIKDNLANNGSES